MGLWLPLLAGAGLAKGLFADAPRANRQRKLAAETTRYSPWTGLQAQQVQEADPFGSALQGLATGASMDQAISDSDWKKKFLESNPGSASMGGGWGGSGWQGLLSMGSPGSFRTKYFEDL